MKWYHRIWIPLTLLNIIQFLMILKLNDVPHDLLFPFLLMSVFLLGASMIYVMLGGITDDR